MNKINQLIERLRIRIAQMQESLSALSDNEVDYLALSNKAQVSELSVSSSTQQLLQALNQVEQQINHLGAKASLSDNISLHQFEFISNQLSKIYRIISLKNKHSITTRAHKTKFTKNYNIDWSNPHAELVKLKEFESRLQQQLTELIDIRATSYKVEQARARLQRCRDTIAQIKFTAKE